VYELKYAYIESFGLSFDGYYMASVPATRELTVKNSETSQTYAVHNNAEFKEIIEFDNAIFEVELPAFRVICDGNDIVLTDDACVWHKDVSYSAKAKFTTPWGFDARLFVGGDEINGKYFDIGNYVQLNSSSRPNAVFWAKIGDGGIKQRLFELVFIPRFSENPVRVYDRSLEWNPAFIGDASSRFELHILRNGTVKKQYDQLTTQHLRLCNLPDAKYTYEVLLVEKSFFAPVLRKLCDGEFGIGNPNAYKYDGKKIVITGVVWGKEGNSLEFGETKVIIDSLKLLEGHNYVAYEGILQFWRANKKQYWPYSSEDKLVDEKEILKVNPVHIHFINDNILAMTTDEGQRLNVDKKFKTITHYEQTDNVRGRYIIERYYSYKIVDAEELQNV